MPQTFQVANVTTLAVIYYSPEVNGEQERAQEVLMGGRL